MAPSATALTCSTETNFWCATARSVVRADQASASAVIQRWQA
jgi:hypothetical protein